MEDVLNPSDGDLRAWAFTPDAAAPHEDWGIAITTHERGPLFLEFAENLDCPNGDFFLDCLYILVGDMVLGHGPAPSPGIYPRELNPADLSLISCPICPTIADGRQSAFYYLFILVAILLMERENHACYS